MSQNDAPAAPADESIDPSSVAPAPPSSAPALASPSHATATGTATVYARTSKVDQLTHLLRHLDSLVFIQLGLVYYHDNLSFLLALRALSQVLYVQPKPAGLLAAAAAEANITGLAPLLVVNLLCFITHVLHSQPGATTSTSTSSRNRARGWIHGGLLTDFVGEQGPISRWVLVGFDLIVLVLQLVMLMVGHEKRRVEGGDGADAEKTAQDLAAEEAGIRASSDEGGGDGTAPTAAAAAAAAAAANADIEMDHLLPDGSSRPHSDGGSSSTTTTTSTNAHGTDDSEMIAVIDLVDSLKQLARRAARTTPSSSSVENEERAARVRALLIGRLLAERLAVAR